MCGRYAITSTPEAIRQLLGYLEQPNFPPRYNVAPTQPIPIVRLEQGARRFALVRWGLIPAWVEDPRTFSLVINARGDNVLSKPAFRNAMRYRRCLIPADGFYEWQEIGGGPRRPFYVHAKDGAPFAFAGLWEVWSGPNGEEMETAAIVTTDANRALRPIHPRMPVILAPEAYDLWLDCRNVDAETAAALIAPPPEDLLEAYPVSMAVNRHANDDASLIAPVTEEQAKAEGDRGASGIARAKTRQAGEAQQGRPAAVPVLNC
ncbi:MAG: SOS response-associated peptidase [Rhizobiales bacterium]|nr:SOS response-associated peptidase [Hyphomicrobiales bacterium]